MFETFITAMAYVLTRMFLVGAAGCIIALPIVAYKMFAVLFEHDDPNE